eukprot:Skav226048  [mRNA]  locus=scaffold211:106333:113667:+ [translate_table: standard]
MKSRCMQCVNAYARPLLESQDFAPGTAPPKSPRRFYFDATLFRYRYVEPIRRRAEIAACGLCDAREREHRRTEQSANAKVAVAFCIMSRRSAHELRQVVRETWGKGLAGKAPSVVQRFFVGKAANTSHVLHDLDMGDVVELPVVESYRTLNIKALSMLSWAHKTYPNLQWLVRHDDDVYLRAPALLAQLSSRPPIRYFWGMFDHGSSPVRDPSHQHYNSYEQFPQQKHPAWGDIFPPYVARPRYLLTILQMYKVIDASSRKFPDLCQCSTEVEEEEDGEEESFLTYELSTYLRFLGLGDFTQGAFLVRPIAFQQRTGGSFWEEVQRRRREERERRQTTSEVQQLLQEVRKERSANPESVQSPTSGSEATRPGSEHRACSLSPPRQPSEVQKILAEIRQERCKASPASAGTQRTRPKAAPSAPAPKNKSVNPVQRKARRQRKSFSDETPQNPTHLYHPSPSFTILLPEV